MWIIISAKTDFIISVFMWSKMYSISKEIPNKKQTKTNYTSRHVNLFGACIWRSDPHLAQNDKILHYIIIL